MVPLYAVANSLSAESEKFLKATAKVLPASLQYRLEDWVGIIGAIPWYWWALGWASLLLGLVLEGTYQVVSRLEGREDRRFGATFETELPRLLRLLVSEIRKQVSVPYTNQPERHYLDAVLTLIRGHRREDQYQPLMDALQGLSIAYGRVTSYRPRSTDNPVLASMLAPGYQREAQAAIDAINDVLGST